jgi:putative transposase
MSRRRYSEEQIIAVLKKAEQGERVGDLCREYGISDATYYKWKAKYGGMDVSDARRLRQLEDENRRLKKIVADQALDIEALKAVASGNF